MSHACSIFVVILLLCPQAVSAGTWTDHFSQPGMSAQWRGDTNAFTREAGMLRGLSASPVAPSPLNILEPAQTWSDATVECWINVVERNLRVCTKGALILRHKDGEGYVFALHEATQTIELYRISNHEMLFEKPAVIELKRWYRVRAELAGEKISLFVDDIRVGSVSDGRSLSGAFGVAVQDADPVYFDDFTVSGEKVAGNVDYISPMSLDSAVRKGEMVELRFLAEPGFWYEVQSSADVFSPGWVTITNFLSKIQPFEAVATDVINTGSRFYRIEKIDCLCD